MKARNLLAALALGAALLALAPAAATAAASPWWQVLTGSRPTNMWKATDNEQEITSALGEKFSQKGLAAAIAVNGKTIGCLGTSSAISKANCTGSTGFQPTETAAQLQTLLQGAFAAGTVEVTGGPAGTAPFLVVVQGAGAPRIELTAFLGTASSKVLADGGSGRLVVTATNLGDAAVDATTTPVVLTDKLPEGIVANEAIGFGGVRGNAGPVDCAVKAPDEVSCSFKGTLPPYEAIEVEVFATLTGDPPAAGAPGEVTVSGGANGPSPPPVPQTVTVSDQPTPFGIERFSAQGEEEGGGVTTRAGVHPFQFTTTIQLNSGFMSTAPARDQSVVEQPAIPRNFDFVLPPGLVGSALAVNTCPMEVFQAIFELHNACPDDAAVGVAAVTVIESSFYRLAVPVFNLPPAYGEPARFGFVAGGVPVVIGTSVDPANGYAITASVRNAPQAAQFLSSTVSLWGTPGDPAHDNARGWNCVSRTLEPLLPPCERPPSLGEEAFLRQPVSCSSALLFSVAGEPWNAPLGTEVVSASHSGPAPLACNQVPFNPSISAAATSKLAQNPSGLEFELTMPNSGWDKAGATAEGQPKRIEVDLPEGMTVNPSQGEGLAGCSPAEFARESAQSAPGEGCPNASKVGEVRASSPLVAEEARGAVYVASPYDNPSGSLLALYMVARIPERGVIVKQAGRVIPDPVTGQLTTVFDDLPQLPYSRFHLRFREGGRAPLVTPPACGTYETEARFLPWSASDLANPDPSEIVVRKASFTVERGVDGGACPGGGTPPFRPGLLAGTTNNAAGHYSPFNIRLTRDDGEQEFTNFSIKLPPGVVGKLAGIPFCPEAAIAQAKGRSGPTGGAEELASPSCPAASEIGRTLVGAGVGSILTYVPGKLYMAGPYNGSPLSVVAITAAKVGPFDLGTVVVRQALRINPETAEVFVDATGSDPIPHIIQGIPVHARDIRVYVDRPNFVLNPTSCEPTSTASTVLGSGLDFSSAADDFPVTVTSPFQAADCASLGFKPKLEMSLKGKTRRGGNPALRTVMRPRVGDANAARISVALPRSEFLDQGHIRTVCTRVQFRAGAGNGAECPAGAVYGQVRAWTPLFDQPLEGPVFLRSSENPLPDLVLALRGLVDVQAVGRIDSVKGGIRVTFDFVPDAPITKVVVDMGGGRKSLLQNSTNICRGKHEATVKMKGHNGAVHNFAAPLKASCGKGRGKKR